VLLREEVGGGLWILVKVPDAGDGWQCAKEKKRDSG
jgi:hypothetical protein